MHVGAWDFKKMCTHIKALVRSMTGCSFKYHFEQLYFALLLLVLIFSYITAIWQLSVQVTCIIENIHAYIIRWYRWPCQTVYEIIKITIWPTYITMHIVIKNPILYLMMLHRHELFCYFSYLILWLLIYLYCIRSELTFILYLKCVWLPLLPQ